MALIISFTRSKCQSKTDLGNTIGDDNPSNIVVIAYWAENNGFRYI